MKSISARIRSLVSGRFDAWAGVDDATASVILPGGRWSLKQIIGHLIDSASNNHQRFVRLRIAPGLVFPGYHYDWITIEKYNEMSFQELLLLWKYYNLLLSNLIGNTEDGHLGNIWKSAARDYTLKELMEDYLAHLEGHIRHFEDRLGELKTGPVSTSDEG